MNGQVSQGQAEDLRERPIGELVQQLSEQMSRLVREELRLAQLELAQKGKRAGIGAGLFGGSGLLSLYGLAAVIAGVALLLALVVPGWAAALIVGAALLAAAGALALTGKRQVRKATPPAPQQMIDSVKADVEVVKERARR
ncbi:MAG TPA: phage holin family protein [Actinomycetes bacterium]|nr:phage holin family protein [Actinomycetes bacterium]